MRDLPGQDLLGLDGDIPAHAEVDITGSLRVSRHAEAYVTANNLLNTAVLGSRRPFGARPGRPFHLMVGLKFGLQPEEDGLVEIVRAKLPGARDPESP